MYLMLQGNAEQMLRSGTSESLASGLVRGVGAPLVNFNGAGQITILRTPQTRYSCRRSDVVGGYRGACAHTL